MQFRSKKHLLQCLKDAGVALPIEIHASKQPWEGSRSFRLWLQTKGMGPSIFSRHKEGYVFHAEMPALVEQMSRLFPLVHGSNADVVGYVK